MGTTFELDELQEEEHTVITFVPHDVVINMRLTSFSPEIWIMYVGFPYDYQTQHYNHKPVDTFGTLLEWHNPRGDRRFVLLKARVIHLRLVPKSIIMRQIGGARRCWTVADTMLRSSDWNAHLPEVPPAGEEPPLPDGNPHPQFGPDLTAEQLYQQQVHNWLVQNAAPNEAPAPPVQNEGWGAWPEAPAPPAPPVVMPPHLMNYQAWLNAQGLTF